MTHGLYDDMAWFVFQTRDGRKSSGFSFIGWGGSAALGRALPIHYCEGHEESTLSWAALDDDFHFGLERSLLALALLLGLLIKSRSRQN